MNARGLVLALAAVLLTACDPAQTDPQPTIGALNPDVTQTTIHTTICVPGWTTRIRPPAGYTNRLERQQIRALGLPGTPADYEEDHLMPLGLGGAPYAEANLRPVPLAVAKRHDASERDLQRQVCAGRITLTAAQHEITQIKAELEK